MLALHQKIAYENNKEILNTHETSVLFNSQHCLVILPEKVLKKLLKNKEDFWGLEQSNIFNQVNKDTELFLIVIFGYNCHKIITTKPGINLILKRSSKLIWDFTHSPKFFKLYFRAIYHKKTALFFDKGLFGREFRALLKKI